MDSSALFKIGYGLYVLGTGAEGRANACIINTAVQVANDPVRISISVINNNLSAELLKKNGYFALSVLDESVKFETIKYFGFQSGRKVDKLGDLPLERDSNGMPYLTWQVNAVISCKVVEQHDLGSHTLFIGEVQAAKVMGEGTSVTYDFYQKNIKPQPVAAAPMKKIKAWRCRICGYVYEGEQLPKDYLCPLCGHDASDFEPVYE